MGRKNRRAKSPFDGDPAYRRLRDLRESGYDGPIDQDGNPVPVDDPRAQVLDALRRTSR